MTINVYKFTGFYPSGNPFKWYYDENKHTMFLTTLETIYWSKRPVIGDEIVLHKRDDTNVIARAYINNELVYTEK